MGDWMEVDLENAEKYEHECERRALPVCPTCNGYGNFYDCPDCLDGKAMPPVTQ